MENTDKPEAKVPTPPITAVNRHRNLVETALTDISRNVLALAAAIVEKKAAEEGDDSQRLDVAHEKLSEAVEQFDLSLQDWEPTRNKWVKLEDCDDQDIDIGFIERG